MQKNGISAVLVKGKEEPDIKGEGQKIRQDQSMQM
jgi:hypothetical protein